MTEKKKKSKAPIILVIILLLAAGGFGYYKFMYLPEVMKTYELSDIEGIETMEIDNVPYDGSDDSSEGRLDVCEVMKNSAANYFSIEDTTDGTGLHISQVNRATFDEASPLDIGDASHDVMKAIKYLLNSSDKSIPAQGFEDINGQNALGGFGASSMVLECEQALFGTTMKKYFMDHELAISCDKVELKKIGIEDMGIITITWDPSGIEEDIPSWQYYYVATADVTTERAVGDLSDLGIFAPAGETKEIVILVSCGYDETSFAMDSFSLK